MIGKCKMQNAECKMLNRTMGWLIFGLLLLIISVAAFADTVSVVSDGPLGTTGVGKTEVTLGDLVSDALRSAIGANFAFVSASELKERNAPIPAGRVTGSDLIAFIAYPGDPVVEVRLTGKQVKQAIERSVLIYPQPNLGFLQVSGLRFAVDANRAPGSRITSISDEVGRQLSDTETYSVAMTSSLANGALGYWKIWSKSDIKPRPQQTSIPQAIDSFLAARSRINYSTTGRITIGG